MRTAAPREAARTGVVALHYLRLLGSESALPALGLIVTFALLTTMNSRGFEGMAATAWLMVSFPLLQWGAAVRGSGLDEAVPLGSLRHDLLRVACGAAWAAAALATVVGFVGILSFGNARGMERVALAWYAVLMMNAGLTYYLLGAAAWLRGTHRGLLPVAIALLAFVPFLVPRPTLARAEALLSLRESPDLRELLAWTIAQGAWTAAAAATVWLAASAPRWAPRVRAAGRWSAARAWPRRAAVPADAPRRPAPLHRVLGRELVILAPHTVPIGAMMVLLTLWVQPTLDAIGGNPSGASWFGPIHSFSLAFPAAVWLRYAGLWRPRLEPLPVGAVAQRLVRVAAGAVWLEAAVLLTLAGRAANLAGWTPPSALLAREAGPWAGIACAALLPYLIASVPLLVAREHLAAWAVAGSIGALMITLPIAPRAAPHGRFSFTTAISTFGYPGPWVGAVLLWTAILVAVAAAAAALGVALERSAPFPSAGPNAARRGGGGPRPGSSRGTATLRTGARS